MKKRRLVSVLVDVSKMVGVMKNRPSTGGDTCTCTRSAVTWGELRLLGRRIGYLPLLAELVWGTRRLKMIKGCNGHPSFFRTAGRWIELSIDPDLLDISDRWKGEANERGLPSSLCSIGHLFVSGCGVPSPGKLWIIFLESTKGQ